MPADERSRQILEATGRVIARDGIAKATTRNVAAEAGAPLASLHYTFRNKEDLLAGVYTLWVEQGGERIAQLVPDGCGLPEGVRLLMTGMFDWYAAEPEVGMAQFELFFWALRTPSAGDLGQRFYREFRAQCAKALERASGGTHDRKEIAELTSAVFCLFDGLLIKILAGDARAARKDLARFLGIADALATEVPAKR